MGAPSSIRCNHKWLGLAVARGGGQIRRIQKVEQVETQRVIRASNVHRVCLSRVTDPHPSVKSPKAPCKVDCRHFGGSRNPVSS